MKVILIDGPRRGDVVDVPAGRQNLVVPIFHVPVFHAPEGIESGHWMLWDELFHRAVYNIFSAGVGDLEARIGTTKSLSEAIDSPEWHAVQQEMYRQAMAA